MRKVTKGGEFTRHSGENRIVNGGKHALKIRESALVHAFAFYGSGSSQQSSDGVQLTGTTLPSAVKKAAFTVWLG